MARTDGLAGRHCIYVDANIFIYFVEGAGAERETATALFLEAADRGIRLVTGEISIAECLRGVIGQDEATAASIYRDLFSNGSIVEMVAADPILYEYAALAGSLFSLKLVDAIHLASAVMADCDAFLTNDKGIRGPETLQIIRLSDLI